MERASWRVGVIWVLVAILVAALIAMGIWWWPVREPDPRYAPIDESSFTPPTLEEFVQKIAETPWDHETTEVNTTVMEVNRSIGMMRLYMTWPPPCGY